MQENIKMFFANCFRNLFNASYANNNIENNITTKGEIQLTDALDKVRENSGIMGFVFNGKVFDVGTPEMYRDTIMNYGM